MDGGSKQIQDESSLKATILSQNMRIICSTLECINNTKKEKLNCGY
jgi:hypothetical protein